VTIKDGITFFAALAKGFVMPNWLRALIAGYGAKKLGGGCLSTIIIFVLIYWMLGHC
jgi:hypothetical protein